MRPFLLMASIVVLAACASLTPARTFDLVIDQPPGFDPLPIRVSDATGLVRDVITGGGVAAAPLEGRGGLSNPPGQPNGLVVQWLGGVCDQSAVLAVSRGGEGRLHLVLDTTVAQGDCEAMGIFRALRLTLSVPVDPSEANLDFALK